MDFFDNSTPGWYALAILLLPLAGFLWNAITFRTEATRTKGHVVPLLTIGAALFCAIVIFKNAVIDYEAPAHDADSSHGAAVEPADDAHGAATGSLADTRWNWSSKQHGMSAVVVDTGSVKVDAGIAIDHLTATMLLVVTVVAFLVHLYSVGYMHGDKRYSRFFAFLQLFSFSMLGLILTDNLLLLFCFWELVGVCSYFLIGFWFEQDEPPKASIKALMTNRFGDVGFLIGLLLHPRRAAEAYHHDPHDQPLRRRRVPDRAAARVAAVRDLRPLRALREGAGRSRGTRAPSGALRLDRSGAPHGGRAVSVRRAA